MGKPPNNQAKNREKFTFKNTPIEHYDKYQLPCILGLGNGPVFNVFRRDGLFAIVLKININIYLNDRYSLDPASGTSSW